uniref:Uncharacterized protein n=1 Tax=Plectus sambesii TaxID=2011161 RepID=A0A914VDE3_9BILA
MSLSKVPSFLTGRGAQTLKLWNVRCITTHRMLDLADAAAAKTKADAQLMSAREYDTVAHKTQDAHGFDDHLKDYLMKEQASCGYSAEVQVYDDAKIISENVMHAQMKKSSKRVTTLTY